MAAVIIRLNVLYPAVRSHAHTDVARAPVAAGEIQVLNARVFYSWDQPSARLTESRQLRGVRCPEINMKWRREGDGVPADRSNFHDLSDWTVRSREPAPTRVPFGTP